MDQTAQVLLLLNALVALVIPLITQTLSHSTAPEQVKAILNLGIAAVVGVATPFLTGSQSLGSVDWKIVGLSVTQVWVGSIVAHYGLLKPAGITGIGGLIDTLTGNVGVGKSNTVDVTGVPADTIPPAGAVINDSPTPPATDPTTPGA